VTANGPIEASLVDPLSSSIQLSHMRNFSV
jgi:hypothetical protein